MSKRKVWIVTVGDCSGSSIIAVCRTRAIALREWNRQRLKLLRDARRTAKQWPGAFYSMVENLQCRDPEKINNFPNYTPLIKECELVTE